MFTLALALQVVVLRDALGFSITDFNSSSQPWYYSYCNKDPSVYAPQPLTRTDAALVDSLIQLQVLTRHGARVSTKPIAYYFPTAQKNSSTYQEFNCEYLTLTSRTNAPKANVREYATMRKYYPDKEEYVEGNCLSGQSVEDLYTQHKVNGRMLAESYLSDGSKPEMRLFDSADMRSVVDCMLQAKCDWWSRLFHFRSSDMERTLASSIALVSNMLAPSLDSGESVSTLTLDLAVNDLLTDPYNPTHDWKCINLSTYVKDRAEATAQYKAVSNSELSQRVHSQWQQAAGSKFSKGVGSGSLPLYCYGLNIPVSESLYNDTLTFTYQLKNALKNNNETSLSDMQLGSAPMAQLLLDLLPSVDSVTGRSQYYSFVHHSVHDTTQIYLLGGLGVFNGVNPIFAEMLALEVYTSSNFASGFAFRWLRNGKPLAGFSAMKGCRPKGLVSDSLCDLQLLLDLLDAYAMPTKEWQTHCVEVTSK